MTKDTKKKEDKTFLIEDYFQYPLHAPVIAYRLLIFLRIGKAT